MRRAGPVEERHDPKNGKNQSEHRPVSRTCWTATAIAAAIAWSCPAQAVSLGGNLITNGDFESDTGNVLQPTGWTLTPSPTNPRAAAVGGIGKGQSRGFFFGSTDFNDELSQVVQTKVGREYQIDMWISADNFLNESAPDNLFFAQFLPYTFNFTMDFPDTGYFLLSTTRMAFSTATTFNVFGNSRSGNIYIDEISVREVLAEAAVAEPETWAMMLGGFALVGAAARRRTASLQRA